MLALSIGGDRLMGFQFGTDRQWNYAMQASLSGCREIDIFKKPFKLLKNFKEAPDIAGFIIIIIIIIELLFSFIIIKISRVFFLRSFFSFLKKIPWQNYKISIDSKMVFKN